MRRKVYLATTLALAAAVFVGCLADKPDGPGEPALPDPELTATLVVVEGPDGALEIDDSYHDALRVYRGQRVRWRVRCDGCDEQDELEFTVADLHLVSELQGPEDVPEAPHEPPVPCEELSERGADRDRDHPLFGDWTPPQPWTAKTRAIESAPVRQGPVAHGLWKYTWKVRRAGEPESAVCWDPHIFGHPGIRF